MASNNNDESSTRPTKQKEEADEVDSEDEELALAAAKWASENKGTVGEDTTRPSTSAHVSTGTVGRHQHNLNNNDDTPSQPLSLHVTQLSFQATDYQVRSFFVEHGCTVTSVRLVYDTSINTKTFRGVAFVDVADDDSYQQALKLNRSTLLGRRINVRPTRTKRELASIVQRTRQVVAEKIHSQKESKDKEVGDNDKSNNKKRKRKDPNEKQSSIKRRSNKKSTKKKHKRTPTTKDGNDRKLTKKERNRRAAIILSKQRGKR